MPIEMPFAAQRNESFWQISSPPSFARSIAQDAARDTARRTRRAARRCAGVGEDRHEQALAGQQALAGAEQRAHEAALLLAAAVAEDGLHLDAGRHVHHPAGFGDDALARIELDFDELQILAV